MGLVMGYGAFGFQVTGLNPDYLGSDLSVAQVKRLGVCPVPHEQVLASDNTTTDILKPTFEWA